MIVSQQALKGWASVSQKPWNNWNNHYKAHTVVGEVQVTHSKQVLRVRNRFLVFVRDDEEEEEGQEDRCFLQQRAGRVATTPTQVFTGMC